MIDNDFFLTGSDHSGKTTLAHYIMKTRGANYIHSTYNKDWNLENYHDSIGDMVVKMNGYGQDIVLDRWCLDAVPYRFVNKENTYNPKKIWNNFLHEIGNNLILIYCKPTGEFDSNKREEMFNEEDMVTVESEFEKLFKNINHYTYNYKVDGADMEGFINHIIKCQEQSPLDYSWKDNFQIPNIVDEKSIDYSKLPKIVAVDFDGTLSLNTEFPACGDLNIDLANELYNGKYKDYKKVLFTNRTGQALKDAVKWCNDNELIFDTINDNVKEVKDLGLDPRKIYFDIFIDDKVINVKDIGKDV